MKIQCKNLDDTKKLAHAFSSALDKNGAFVTLTGDIGAGKTQFIRYVLKDLGVKEKVTSPSFVILNEYKSAKFPIYHFDLYRLENQNLKTISEELREYSKEGILTFVEWAEFGQDEIPQNSIKIKVEYDQNDVNIRYFNFEDSIFTNKMESELL
ncbi:tRNA (adenosine(37)-N6)-threonylcarbamoyltransferase complex ATPase subunit type 1 TsaE [bacterium]|nr:tRNA (adenosine(37)-N6)-threonylcarbamoyltransferase complex ATPase subunit type 1 TsaE [bacterium]